MDTSPNNPKSRWKATTIIVGIMAVSGVFTTAFYLLQEENPAPFIRRAISSFHKENAEYFAPEYPVSKNQQEELEQLRRTGKLSSEKEDLIKHWIVEASQRLDIPEALLWCLLFQESRFDHLAGINGDIPSLGIGQFSHYSFYEINHHLTKYTEQNLRLMQSAAGRDPRPINALNKDATDPASYYHIPTAISASASYLNNRYLELATILDNRKISYNPELLWFFAAMAYNKGTRSVLTLWNEQQKEDLPVSVEESLTNGKGLFRTMKETRLIQRAMNRIWSGDQAYGYAKELLVHMRKIEQCSMRSKFTAALDTTGDKTELGVN